MREGSNGDAGKRGTGEFDAANQQCGGMLVMWESYHYCHLKITLALGGCGVRNGERAKEEVITVGLLACMQPSLNIHTRNWD